jgi:hypothetical protein
MLGVPGVAAERSFGRAEKVSFNFKTLQSASFFFLERHYPSKRQGAIDDR